MKVYFERRPDEKKFRAIDVAHALIDADLGVDMLDEIAGYLRVYVRGQAMLQARQIGDIPGKINDTPN